MLIFVRQFCCLNITFKMENYLLIPKGRYSNSCPSPLGPIFNILRVKSHFFVLISRNLRALT